MPYEDGVKGAYDMVVIGSDKVVAVDEMRLVLCLRAEKM